MKNEDQQHRFKFYTCVKCGRPTVNSQVIGPHCTGCWEKIIITTIEVSKGQNIYRFLEKEKN